jgi:hypothetical protein
MFEKFLAFPTAATWLDPFLCFLRHCFIFFFVPLLQVSDTARHSDSGLSPHQSHLKDGSSQHQTVSGDALSARSALRSIDGS